MGAAHGGSGAAQIVRPRFLCTKTFFNLFQGLAQFALLLRQPLFAAIFWIAHAFLMAQCFVEQCALAAHQIAEFADRLIRGLVFGRLALSAAARARRHLHVFEHGLQHRQHLRRLLARAGLRELFYRFEQRFEVGLAEHFGAGRNLAAAGLCVLCHEPHVALQRIAIALQQRVNLILRCTARKGFVQRLLQTAQFDGGQLQTALFKRQRGLPQQIVGTLKLFRAACRFGCPAC